MYILSTNTLKHLNKFKQAKYKPTMAKNMGTKCSKYLISSPLPKNFANPWHKGSKS